MRNRKIEITKGCAESSPILVAVDADAHKKAKAIPIKRSFHSLDLTVVACVTTFAVVFKI